MASVIIAALPQTASAEGEIFSRDHSQSQEMIFGNNGRFDATGLTDELGGCSAILEQDFFDGRCPTVLLPLPVTFTQDGATWTATQDLTVSDATGELGPVECFMDHTITIGDTPPTPENEQLATLRSNPRGCPGSLAGLGDLPIVIANWTNENAPTPEETAADTEADCLEQNGDNGWLVCPLILGAADAVKSMTSFIVNQLKLDTDQLFENEETTSAYRTAWAGFRNIAYALLVIIGLAMIASQILNLDWFNAYTIRKMLPGLIMATIFVTLSWNVLEFLFNFSNDAADAVMEIIRRPFEQIGSVEDAVEASGRDASFSFDNLNELGAAVFRILQLLGLTAVGTVAAATFFVLGGWVVVLSLLASLALFIFSIVILLAARNVAADLLVIVAPIAIIARSFEPFQKLFSFWWLLVLAILLSVPAVAAILTFSGVAALIAAAAGGPVNLITAFIILIAAIFLVWTLFIQFDKITGYAGNVASRVTGKAQEGLSSYRKNTIGRRRQEAIEGQRDMRVFGIGRGPFNVGRTMRRTHLAGQAGKGGFVGTHNRARLAAAEQAMMQQSAKKRLEEEGGRMSGDDDAMSLAMQRGMTRERFIPEYERRTGRDGRRALADMEASFGADIGSNAMRVAAAKARWGSVSAYNDFDIDTPEGARDMYRQMMQDAGEMVADGQMSVTDVVAAMKANSQRADISGHSFPQMMEQVQTSANRLQQVRTGQVAPGGLQGRVLDENGQAIPGLQQATGVRRDQDGNAVGPSLISDSEIDNWMRGSLEYPQSMGQIVAGRTETVRILSNQMRERLQRSVDAQQQAEQFAAQQAQQHGGNSPQAATAQQDLQRTERETKRQLATLAGRYDAMGAISPENARFMADNVMAHDINMGAAGNVNIQQLIEHFRADPEFQQHRREYQASAMQGAQAQQAAAAAQAAGVQQPQPPNVVTGP